MSRTIVVVDRGERSAQLAHEVARALSRRVVSTSVHDDEVVLASPEVAITLDYELACILAPEPEGGMSLRDLLDWAMERGDVLTRWEHEQVMP